MKICLLLLEGISIGELTFVFLIVLLFFGSKSIPKLARTMGRGIRQVKDASQQIQDDIKSSVSIDDSKKSIDSNKNKLE
ncbi:MAG: twin-arginine translocase TatA/TatE family subunit [Crocinitomicaceae bacterium]|nr:twin-arginine translocase TatA/TatE family subunit [Crocinitomicaceae bacterium]|tara:strand:- start:870 stop:1106 length:237 start_codon:yes stop_codon:yes gene_type:complete